MAKKKITTGTVRFNLRTDKTKKVGKAPIELIYSLHGQRKYVNAGIDVYPFLWDSEAESAYYMSKSDAKRAYPLYNYNLFPSMAEVAELNDTISGLLQEVKKVEDVLEAKGVKYTSHEVVNELKNRKERNKPTRKEDSKNYLIDFIDQYVHNVKASRNPGTIKVYITTRNHIADYEKLKRTRITLTDAGYGFLQAFYSYLIDVKQQINVTAAKQITTVKTFLSFARKYGYKTNDTYHDYTIKRETLEVIALTNDEFETLYHLDLSGDDKVTIETEPKPRFISYKALAKVRDVFCFSCVTGLRYSDLSQLRKEHIKKDAISLTVTKTKEPIEVPLTPYAMEILSRYPHQIKSLPVISSQKFNEYLKALCKYAGISEQIEIVRYKGAKREAVIYPKYELISAHTGRKTFATLSLEKGMNAEEVMAITGHRSYASFKRYVKITQERRKKVMLDAWGDLNKAQ
ncbi:site-specific integrase [Sphingobacterium sp. 1.A.4]|uniref:site-specific integrase n=1 Tax=Sphingobacterium sp. 1.A.4 TaxID=2044603 RepID=UPI000C0C0602|nr:site-specific integrase [Sphingobacterium sp. 1.A.4]